MENKFKKEQHWEVYQHLMKRSWFNLLYDDLQNVDFKWLQNRAEFIDIYPEPNSVFKAFNQFETYKTKVVILGQDPYYTPNIATGLAFAVGIKSYVPPSLRNITSEMLEDLNLEDDDKVKLTNALTNNDYRNIFSEDLASQGVLLLNTALTVERDSPNAHKKLWDEFTKSIISKISTNLNNVIFILWGNNAKSFKPLIDTDKHYVIESAHPSPLSATRGFFGSKPFSKTNEILVSLNKSPIKWI